MHRNKVEVRGGGKLGAKCVYRGYDIFWVVFDMTKLLQDVNRPAFALLL